MHAVLHPSAHDSLADISLTCQRFNEDGSTCGEQFIFSTANQLKYKRLGSTNQPKSCAKHRGQKQGPDTPRHYAANPCKAGDGCNDAKHHHWRGAQAVQCREFKAGTCSCGDQCKFSHSEIHTGHNASMPEDFGGQGDVSDNDSDISVYSW